jgi:hypothetical protein
MRYTHAREVHAHETHACEMHAHEVHACEMQAFEVHANRYTPMRYTPKTSIQVGDSEVEEE